MELITVKTAPGTVDDEASTIDTGAKGDGGNDVSVFPFAFLFSFLLKTVRMLRLSTTRNPR
jgi:hypothetical protein